jgi:adenosylcobinamide kinase / adenosylcobinamide-phosphate guanylyltransferase
LIANNRKLGKLVLVLGGARSGKSNFAQELAAVLGGDQVLFVATAEARDHEMSRRIQLHRESRSANWQTLEQPLQVGDALATYEKLPPVIVLDCLTLLVSNVVLQEGSDADLAEQKLRAEIDSLLQLIERNETCMIIVSGEVGLGLVPDNALGRLFRDLLGWSNQLIAKHADATYFMFSGQAINSTKLASSVQQAALGLGNISIKAERS